MKGRDAGAVRLARAGPLTARGRTGSDLKRDGRNLHAEKLGAIAHGVNVTKAGVSLRGGDNLVQSVRFRRLITNAERRKPSWGGALRRWTGFSEILAQVIELQ